jgi:amino acid transporter
MSTPSHGGSPGANSLLKTVGPWQLMLYGIGSMLGAGIYALIGKVAGVMGSMVWLAFAAAMVAALLTGFTYACVGSRFPKAAGAAYVTQQAFRTPWLSYVIGIAVMMSGLTSMATGAQAIAGNLHHVIGDAIPLKYLAIGLVAMLGVVIFAGIRQSMWMNMVCTIIEVSGLLFIIAVGAKYWGSVSYTELPPAAATGDGSSMVFLLVLQGAVLTFFAFIGFEDILNVSEEVVDPERNVPRGLIGAMLISTVIYMAVAITAVSVIPSEVLAQSKAPLMDVAHTAAPWFQGIDSVFLGITIVSIGNTALLNYLMGSRLLFGMSRQGLLPAILSRLNARTHTPSVAIVLLFCIVSALILSGGVKELAEATVLLLLGVFTVLNIALVLLKRRPGEPRGRFEVPMFVPVLGALVCGLLIIVRGHNAVTSTDPANRVAPLVAAAIVGVALLLFFVIKPKRAVAEEVN